MLGLLESRTPSFFAEVRPVNFTTFASPAIGIPRYDGSDSSLSASLLVSADAAIPSQLLELRAQLSRCPCEDSASKAHSGSSYSEPIGLLSRSGSQLYGSDRFLPSSLLDGNNQPTESKGPLSRLSGKREKAEPLLAVMADPQYSFFRALAAFERVEIYANS